MERSARTRNADSGVTLAAWMGYGRAMALVLNDIDARVKRAVTRARP
jgi:hypothetical protein